MQYILGGVYNPNKEHLLLEFKKFCLNKIPLDDILTSEDINNILVNGLWITKLNYIVIENIKFYLRWTLPRYISCFGNIKKDSKLLIGVDDSGEITGIPYLKDLPIEVIKSLVNKSIRDFIVSDDSFEIISSNIDINLIKLDIDLNILSNDIDDVYETYKQNYKEYNGQMKEYIIKWHTWERLILRKYVTKLSTLINTYQTRKELIDFIEKECRTNVKSSLITRLNSDEKFEYETKEIFSFETKDIEKIKYDETSMVYWLIEFKDKMTKYASSLKPKKPINCCNTNVLHLVGEFSCLRKKLLTNNKDINYYIIEICINASKFNHNIYFKLPNNDSLNYRERVSSETGEPYCI